MRRRGEALAARGGGGGGRGRRGPDRHQRGFTAPPCPCGPDRLAAGRSACIPAPPSQVFGINVNRLFNDLTYTQAHIDAQLAAVRATGATVARSDALWEAAEPHAPAGGRHRYDWSFDDQIAGSLAAHGLTWLPIIDYTAPWAQSVSGQDHSPPRSDADYAAYAGAFAARYGSGGTFWRAHPGAGTAAGDGDRDLERARQPRVLDARPRCRRLRPAVPGRARGHRRGRPGDPGAGGRPHQRVGVPAGDGARGVGAARARGRGGAPSLREPGRGAGAGARGAGRAGERRR